MNNLKQLRKQTKKTQQEVAKELGINEKTYNKYENLVNEPDIETLKKLADYFHTSVDYLINHTSETIELNSFPDYKRDLIENSIKLNEQQCEKANAYVEGLLAAGYTQDDIRRKIYSGEFKPEW